MRVDPTDLLNASEVAVVLGLTHREAVSTYRKRYPDFPQPVSQVGRACVWNWADVERWAKKTGRL